MQSGGGGNGHGRNPTGWPPTSSAAPPSSSSSAASAQHLGFDSSQQLLQQQFFRKPEGNEALLAYQAGGLQGVVGGSNFFPSTGGSAQLPQHYRKFDDSAMQHGGPVDDGQNRRQGVEQQLQNHPIHQPHFPFAFQTPAKSAAVMSQSPQQARVEMMGPSSGGKDQDIAGMGTFRRQQEAMTELTANESQASSSKNAAEHFASGEKQLRHMLQPMAEQRNEMRQVMQPSAIGQFSPASTVRPPQSMQAQQFSQSMSSSQMAMAAQMQAMQAWARENNIDLSVPANANMMIKLMPLMQARMAAQQKANDSNGSVQQPLPLPSSKPPTASPSGTNVGSPHVNSPSEVSMASNSGKTNHSVPPSSSSVPGAVKYNNNATLQQFSPNGRENQAFGKSIATESGMLPMTASQPAINATQIMDQSSQVKTALSGPEALQAHYPRQLNESPAQSSVPSRDGGSSILHQVGAPQQPSRFTKEQLHVLKAQILAFRRIKKGEGTLPQELLQAIAPPPLEMQQLQQPQQQQQQQQQQHFLSGGANSEDKSAAKIAEHVHKHLDSADIDGRPVPPAKTLDINNMREGVAGTEEKPTSSTGHMKDPSADATEHKPMEAARKEEPHDSILSVESEKNAANRPVGNGSMIDKGKTAESLLPTSDAVQGNNAQSSTASCPRDVGAARKYAGPLFDFPFFTRKHDSFGSSMMVNNNNNLTLAYNVKDLLSEEGVEVINRRRAENLKKIGGLLAVNLERKRIRPDLVLRLQIEEKKLRLLDIQARLRDEVDSEQQEIMAMPDRPYRKFVRLCERQRMELTRQVQVSQKAAREKQLKSIFQWRKKLLEAHWVIRDARIARNRGVAKYHERMLREFSKRKDDHRNKRMEALKNNDVERYREMLLEQQNITGEAAERYAVLSTFLTQTEEYLQKLGGKITAAKTHQEVEEAANAAATAARLQGLSEEEVRAAAACAGDEVMIRHQFVEMNAPKDGSYVNKYYNLAHAVDERVVRQPSMLRAGTLRDYQIVGLQWMLSLYNNKLNGILADEMGLGKTVQVMALIAYLMEFKGNYGPHLIIVPNAVLVNWKSELHTWLPSVSCIYYVGTKDQRSKLFSQEVSAMKFNVLVTTYEFIMFDRSKLSKVDWKYIIIDEAQRMKDRESVLARDLDRYRCQRRLLLTGTPLQNDLKELWSLLNLLLPEVFDNKKVFHDWFSKPFQREGPTDAEDDWLETEKKVIIIHRLHQILEPFMLRRRVEDVEGSLPPKVSIVLRCKMSAIQSAIYDWIKSTGTLRIDPEDEKLRAQKSSIYQARTYRTLNNRCMELRKACNHPLLNYPYYSDLSKEFLVKSCGKLWVLDRILVKLHRTGHRVLLFSTMTKLLDILEEYLQWRRLVYRRIDGTTSLEDRESAIVDFNSPGTDCFIFLLSIRAAGRGLNLQSADTVVIYDPDPNPKNEEQAVARAHRIGQTREVKVIYLEAVVDKISIHQKEDELRSGGQLDLEEDDLAGKDRYMGSIESLIRNNIQQYKIDMADEVINAGRFDQRTTHEERRLTLETLLHDEERYQENVHNVPSLQEVNRMIARSEEEIELFDQMDEELDWVDEMTIHEQVPKWLRASSKEVNGAVAALSKKPSKNRQLSSGMEMESNYMGSESPKTERKRGRPKNYKELDDDDDEYLEASSDDGNKYSVQEEEGEAEEFDDDDEFQGSGGVLPPNKEPSEEEEEEDPTAEAGNEYLWETERTRNNHVLDQPTSSGSSGGNRRLRVTSPVSSQKFGSLSALDSRPPSSSNRMADELEEGEIAGSGDSRLDHQQSGSLIHDRDEGEDEQVLQPKIRRKRSIRMRPRHALEKQEKSGDMTPTVREDSPTMPFHMDHKYQSKMRNAAEASTFLEPNTTISRQGQTVPSSKSRRQMPSRRVPETSLVHALPKSGGRSSHMAAPADAADEHLPDISSSRGQMSDAIQRKCKNVISKLQRRIDKEGDEVVPVLMDLWRRTENSSGYMNAAGQNLITLRKIDQRVDKLEYHDIMDLVYDVQLMLKGAMQHFGFSHEVRSEAVKVHDLFFDILKIAFPDLDFREARSALSFAAPSGGASSSSLPPSRLAAASQSKRQRPIDEVQADPNPPPQKALRRGGTTPNIEEGTRIRVQLPRKEMGRAQSEQDDSPRLAHPGELVICKKKRKEREKTVGKHGSGPSSLPVSPSGANTPRVTRSPALVSNGRETRQSHQATTRQQGLGSPASNNTGGGANVGWANPVKRLRSDSGRRRPSHF